MKRIEYYFNMVEVALALLVISLGLSTVLTLFPAGLKATREAEAANDVAEAAEYFFGYLQTAGSGNIKTVSSLKDDAVTTAPSDSSRIAEVKDAQGNSKNIYIYRKTTQVDNDYAEDFNCIIQVLNAQSGTQCDAKNSTFAYFPAQSGANSIEDHGTRTSKNTYYFTTQGNSSSNFHAYDVELSYPASVERDKRTKRIYRMVVLD